MPFQQSGSVRPTRRALDDLSLKVPHLTEPLDECDERTIRDAQRSPELLLAGGLKRVVSLTDRVWFKVKTSAARAVVTQLDEAEVPETARPVRPDGRWWIGAAGPRQADSPQRDFYDQLKSESVRKAKSLPDGHSSKGTVSTSHLLPQEWDWKRLVAEGGVRWRRELQLMVLDIIAKSLRTNKVVVAESRHHYIKAFVNAESRDEAYLVIGAEGIPDPEVLALILDCVPGISKDDWMWEPSEVRGLKPASGEVIWSAVLPPEVAAEILEATPDSA